MRVLYITRSPPVPTSIGGNQRTYLLYQALSRMADVDLFLAVAPDELSETQRRAIEQRFRLVGCASPAVRVEYALWNVLSRMIGYRCASTLADLLADRRKDYRPDLKLAAQLWKGRSPGDYDAVVIKSLSLAKKANVSPDKPVILDVDDVEYEWFQSQIADPTASVGRKLLAYWRRRQLVPCLPHWYESFRYVWVTKKADLGYPGLGHARVLGIPYYTSDGKKPTAWPEEASSSKLLMVGSYYHRPNREGLRWFLKHVWPRILTARPEATFRVVGQGLSESWCRKHQQPGATFVGAVDNVSDEYRHCAFTIAPIWSGAGINVKVFESYLYGRACVVTPFAWRGYEEYLPKGETIEVAETPEAFARACVKLLDQTDRRRAMVQKGYQPVLAAFSFERFAAVVRETLAEVQRSKISASPA